MLSCLTNIVISLFWNPLVSSVVGFLLGYLSSFHLQKRADKNRRKEAGRAVLAEMVMNAERAFSAESTLVQYDFVDYVWRQQLPLVATLLDWKRLKKLVVAYDSGSRLSSNSREYDPLKRNQEQQNDWKDSLLRHAERELLEAIEILREKVLNTGEAAEFDDDVMKKLKECLADSRRLVDLEKSRLTK